jgi:Flp pilus assembly protein TadG
MRISPAIPAPSSTVTTLARWRQQVDGSSIIETALLMPLLLLILVAAIDFGRAYFMAIEVSSAAEAGALYGIVNPADTAGMVAAAKFDASDVSPLTAIAVYGCQCSDGSSVVASCSTAPTCTYNVVNFVDVSTSATYSSLLNYPGIPSSIALSGKARMRTGH